MAKQIIILDTQPQEGGFTTIRYLLWLPMSPPVPAPNNRSQWPGAAQPDHDAIAAGTVLEESRNATFPSGATVAQIKTALIAAYNARKAWWQAQPGRGQIFGVFFDDVTGWSA